jgi:hypothetical protein
MITVLNPTAGPARITSGLAPRLTSLDDATLGVIWNGRAYGDKILAEVLSVLKKRHRIKEIVFRQKPFIGNVAPDEILTELSAKTNAIITGVGD